MKSADKIVSLSDLACWQWQDVAPFTVNLGECTVALSKPLRFLPGKRLVAFTASGDNSIFKLYLGRKGIKDYQRELESHQLALSAGCFVPEIIKHSEQDSGAWIEFERVKRAEGLHQVIQSDVVQKQYLDALENMFKAGLMQTDPHWDNFLFDGQKLWMVDAGGIRRASRSTDLQDNLGLVVAQCGAADVDIESSLTKNLAQRLSLSSAGLARQVRVNRSSRIARFLKKTLRSSTRIEAVTYQDMRGLKRRALSSEDLQKLVSAIEAGCGDKALKEGRSATVFVCGEYVVKRYNCHSPWQRLKRTMGRDRALKAWQMGHALSHFGITTPVPELYLASPDGTRYLVTRLISDSSELKTLLADGGSEALTSCRLLLESLHRFNFWHGDAKARNFILQGEKAWIIDLDATGWSPRASKASRMMQKDWRRFERNGASE